MKTKKGTNAATWFYSQSFNGRTDARRDDIKKEVERVADFYAGNVEEVFKDFCPHCGRRLTECPCTKREGR